MKGAVATGWQAGVQRRARTPLIYIACPWTPAGGGMFKVADYLLQSQAADDGHEAVEPDEPVRAIGSIASPGSMQDGRQAGASRGHACAHARLAPLDTRGSGHPALSLPVLLLALARIAWGRCTGQLAGVHVNMAERLSLVRKGVLVAACRALGVPVVVHLHAAQLHRAWPGMPGALQALVRWVFSLPACCIALGPASAQFVRASLGVPGERVVVITNGVPGPDPHSPQGQAAAGAPAGRDDEGWRARIEATGSDSQERAGGVQVQALFVGNLSDRKGVPQLLQALALAPLKDLPLRLTLAGGGDIGHYQAMAGQLGVAGKVLFTGWTQQGEVSRLLARSDLFVLPSYDEGLPLAILEALAHGVAVVCTPVGEIPEVLSHGRQALFVTPGQAQELADALADLVRQPERRQALAREGRALHARRFTMQAFLEAVALVHRRHFGVAPRWRMERGTGPCTQRQEP